MSDALRNLIEMWESTARACEKRSPSYDHVLATAATVFRTCAHDLRDELQRMQESEGNVKSEPTPHAFIVRIGVEDRDFLIRLLRAAYTDAVLEADHRRAFQLLVTLGDPEATQGAFSDRG
jgi:hypothetical protein